MKNAQGLNIAIFAGLASIAATRLLTRRLQLTSHHAAGNDADGKLLLLHIANLELDCKLGKDKHFAAAARKDRWRLWLGGISVVGAVLLSSSPAKDASNLLTAASIGAFPQIPNFPLTSIVALAIGITTAIVSFLGLEKQVTEHRTVANKYVEIARKAGQLWTRYLSGLHLSLARKEFDQLIAQYVLVNKEAATCPTSERDYAVAKAANEPDRTDIKDALKTRNRTTLGIAD